jgi:helix-turn-helix protein
VNDLERKLLIVVGFFHARNGVAPSWAEVRHALGLSRKELEPLMHRLRRKGLLDWTRTERSLRLTNRGYARAVGR